MTKEEMIEFIKENLKVKIAFSGAEAFVSLHLEGKCISFSSDYPKRYE